MNPPKMARLAPLALMAVAIAFFAGVVTSSGDASATTVNVARVNPGPAATSPDMTCSWHGLSNPCPTPGDQQALDWANSAGSAVHFRTWAFRGAGTGTAYLAIKEINNSTCRRVRMTINQVGGSNVGTEYYTHTKLYGTDGYTYYITGQTSYYYTSHTIGTSVAPYDADDPNNTDLYGCSSTGAHVHQGASSNAGRNTGVYGGTGTYSNVTDVGKYQHDWQWQE